MSCVIYGKKINDRVFVPVNLSMYRSVHKISKATHFPISQIKNIRSYINELNEQSRDVIFQVRKTCD